MTAHRLQSDQPQSEPTLSERLSKLDEAASAGPWAYRPQEEDDWGMLRSAVLPSRGYAPVAMVARANPIDGRSLDQHREAGTDPYEANGVFVVELVNAYRAGRLKPID